MDSKVKIHKQCLDKMRRQLSDLQAAIAKVQEAIENEQASTAGNKYETARAMNQEKISRLHQQYQTMTKEMHVLSQIDVSKPCNSAQIGALIQTPQKNLYLSIGLGIIQIEDATIYAVSVGSPIGQSLLGKTVGDMIKMGEKTEKITSIH